MIGLGLTAPLAGQMLASAGVAQAQSKLGLQADQAGRRRRAQDAVVAGRHAAESPLRHRHQGPGRLPDLLRAAGLVGPGRQPRADPGRRDPHRAERRARARTASRSPGSSRRTSSGTTASPSPPTTACSPGSTSPIRPPPRCRSARYKDIKVEKVDSHTDQGRLQQADAVLGRRLRAACAAWSSPSTCSPPSRATSRARRRPTSSRSAPGPTGSWTSSRATSCAAS